MEDGFREILERARGLLGPLGWRKDGGNFRLLLPNGLGKIIQFQRDRWNTAEACGFTVNAGVYFERDVPLANRRFPEYDCQIRTRPAAFSPRYGRDTWWTLSAETDRAALWAELEGFLRRDVLPFLERFPSRERAAEMILSGEAQQWCEDNVFHLHTARLLVEMGYGREVLPLAEAVQTAHFQDLAAEIRSKEGRT